MFLLRSFLVLLVLLILVLILVLVLVTWLASCTVSRRNLSSSFIILNSTMQSSTLDIGID